LLWNRDSDIPRHGVVANTTWDLPFGRGRRFLSLVRGPTDHVIGGWRLYWIAYMQTGQFFSPSFSDSDPSNTNTVGGLPDRIRDGNLPPSQRTIDRWFDASAFAIPPKGRFGNSGANILEGPGLHLHNLSIGKSFRIWERFTLTFTAAAQNALNHANFRKPGANTSAPASVGVVSSTCQISPGRQIMLRGRLEF